MSFISIESIGMSGPCPPWIFQPSKLSRLYFDNNSDCEVTVPENFNSSHIKSLAIVRSKFNGTLPQSFFLGCENTSNFEL